MGSKEDGGAGNGCAEAELSRYKQSTIRRLYNKGTSPFMYRTSRESHRIQDQARARAALLQERAWSTWSEARARVVHVSSTGSMASLDELGNTLALWVCFKCIGRLLGIWSSGCFRKITLVGEVEAVGSRKVRLGLSGWAMMLYDSEGTAMRGEKAIAARGTGSMTETYDDVATDESAREPQGA